MEMDHGSAASPANNSSASVPTTLQPTPDSTAVSVFGIGAQALIPHSSVSTQLLTRESIDLTSDAAQHAATAPQSPFWIEALQLRETDKQVLSSGKWISDNLMQATHHILRLQYKNKLQHMEGSLHDTILQTPPASGKYGQQGPLPISLDKSVLQVLHWKKKSHWVLLCTEPGDGVGSELHRRRHVLDSKYEHTHQQLEIEIELMGLLRAMWPNHKVSNQELSQGITYKCPQVQDGDSDCGCFVIAWMVLLLEGIHLQGVQLDQAKLRPWLEQCLSKGAFVGPPLI